MKETIITLNDQQEYYVLEEIIQYQKKYLLLAKYHKETQEIENNNFIIGKLKMENNNLIIDNIQNQKEAELITQLFLNKMKMNQKKEI